MPRIDRYILTQYLTQFGFFALVLVSVYWINRAVQLFEQLIQDGAEIAVAYLNTRLTNDLDKISNGQAQYTMLCQADGGVDNASVINIGGLRLRGAIRNVHAGHWISSSHVGQ